MAQITILKNDPTVQVEVIDGPAPVDQSALVATLAQERDEARAAFAVAQDALAGSQAALAAVTAERDALSAKVGDVAAAVRALQAVAA